MSFGVLVKWRKHDRQNGLHVVTDQIAEVLIVPEVQSTLRNLHVGRQASVGDHKWEIVSQ